MPGPVAGRVSAILQSGAFNRPGVSDAPHHREIISICTSKTLGRSRKDIIFWTASRDSYVKEWRFYRDSLNGGRIDFMKEWKVGHLTDYAEAEIVSMTLTFDGRYLMVLDQDHRIHQLSTISDWRNVKVFNEVSSIRSYQVDWHSNNLYIGDDQGQLNEIYLNEASCRRDGQVNVKRCLFKSYKVTAICCSDDGEWIFIGDCGGAIHVVKVKDIHDKGRSLGQLHDVEVNHITTFRDNMDQVWLMTGHLCKDVLGKWDNHESQFKFSIWNGQKLIEKHNLFNDVSGAKCAYFYDGYDFDYHHGDRGVYDYYNKNENQFYRNESRIVDAYNDGGYGHGFSSNYGSHVHRDPTHHGKNLGESRHGENLVTSHVVRDPSCHDTNLVTSHAVRDPHGNDTIGRRQSVHKNTNLVTSHIVQDPHFDDTNGRKSAFRDLTRHDTNLRSDC